MKFLPSLQITLFVVWISEIQKRSFADVFKKSVLKNLKMFTGKHPCWGLLLVKIFIKLRL